MGKIGRFGDRANEFRGPYGITSDGAGTVWVSDIFNHRISRWEEVSGRAFLAIDSQSWGRVKAAYRGPGNAISR